MKTIIHTLSAFVLAVGLCSCIEQTREVKAVENVRIHLTYSGDEFDRTRPAIEKIVKLRSGSREYTTVTNDEGYALFSGVIPDTYNISSTGNLTAEETGWMVSPPASGIKVLANGVIAAVDIFADYDAGMDMKVGVESNIIISKVYYSASKDDNAKNYATDMYVAFYNNSDEEVTTENLYFALLDTESSPPWLEEKETSVYGKDVYKFPLRTVAPGQTIVFAREARDHTVSAANSVDLTAADYQTMAEKGSPGPDAEELPYIYRTFATIDYLFFVVRGGNAMILFKTDQDPAQWAKRPPNTARPTTNLALEIPVNSIIDGVETLPYAEPINVAKKRLSDKIDASYVAHTSGFSAGYASLSFDRKVADITGAGRKVLKDTNNSLEDFVMLQYKLDPWDYEKSELYTNNLELLP